MRARPPANDNRQLPDWLTQLAKEVLILIAVLALLLVYIKLHNTQTIDQANRIDTERSTGDYNR